MATWVYTSNFNSSNAKINYAKFFIFGPNNYENKFREKLLGIISFIKVFLK